MDDQSNNAKDMSGAMLQGFLDEGNVEKANEVISQLYRSRIGLPDPGSSHIPFVFGGVTVGLGLGGALGYFLARRQLETKYDQLAAEEIAEMRQHYNEKVVALENQTEKPKLDDIVKERGYASTEPPMAITPPEAVIDAAKEAVIQAEDTAAGEPPDEPVVRNIFRDPEPVEDDWDWHKERARRSPLKPYIIHIDEREEQDAYDDVTFTYFEADDVLCNERDEVVDPADRDRLIGEEHLSKFGHGSNSPDLLYIRNDQLEIDFEICLSPNSYAQEVHGFDPPEQELRHANRRLRRTFDDD